ncbi:MAG: two-component sensor histidine kinase, partial [Rhizobacter sp.]|nr:two-component sensor histidine kinase [Rhizobacter sp.]
MPCTKPRWTGSLRLQLLLTYGAALLLTAALLAAAFFIVMSWNEDSVTRKGLMQQVRWIEESLRYDAQGRPVALAADRNSPWVYQSASSDLKYRVLDSRGATLLSSEADSRPLTPAGEAFDPDRQMFEVRSGELRLDAVTVPLDHLGTRYYVQTARSERLAALVRRVIGEPILKTAVWMAVTSLLIFA